MRLALPELRVRPQTAIRALLYVLVAVLATAPAWIVEHPPLQDLPFHVATLRLIHDFHNPAFGFDGVYELNLLHTEYLLYYVVGDVLAYVMGVKAASVGMICLYLGGMPLAMAALLRALGRDERLCLFAVPLSVNVMFCMGLLPFVFGFPLMLLSLAVAVRHFAKPTRRTGVALAVLTVLTFYAHVLPFALFGVGCLALFPWGRPRRWIPAAAPLALGLLLVAWWVLGSKAGGGAFSHLKGMRPFAPVDGALQQLLRWSVNVFRDPSDETWFVALLLVVLLALGLSAGDRDRAEPVARGWFVLPVTCLVAYFSLGDSLGDVWLFGQRFAVPALFTCVPLLRMPRGGRGLLVTVAAAAVAVGSTVNVCKHFIQFERDEVGELDEALALMEPRKHVAGLIYDKGSSVMSDLYVPFMHFVSYYQVEKGGVVQFAYTGFPHWPVQYQPGKFPPPGTVPRLRWEWTPEQVPISELYPYYDYVLTRGGGFHPPAGTFHTAWH
ncbi:MAG TPA: hypothetical protein VHS09_06090, partial [Polyangiaceae bacterium]|nr:hypothetical protein [Polyangiaceae bacterium]